MGVRDFSVNLDTNRQVFYPGERITGYVVVDLQGQLQMRGIKIEFDGKAKCHWTEKRWEGTGEDRREVTHDIEGKEKYFENSTCLYGVLSGTTKYNLPHGRYTYPFAFNIPSNVPSSFEGKFGSIRYELKAEIDIPGKKDLKARRPIIINDIIDTNDPNYQKTPGGEVNKEVGCLCWKGGPLTLGANIDRECYCPGEIILINAQVQNNTNRDMNGLKATLEQEVLYCAQDNKKQREVHVIARLDGPPQILKGKSFTWANQPLAIPATQPTIMKSQVIKISYILKVKVDVPWGFDPAITMQLVLGTVPYRACYGNPIQYGLPQEQMPVPDSNFKNTPAMPPAPPNILGYPDMAPPAYAAVVGSKQVDTHAGEDSELFGNASYVPVYTFAQPYEGNIRMEQSPPPHPSCPPQEPGFSQPQIGFAPQPQPPYPPQQPGYPQPHPGYAPHPGYPAHHPGYPQ